MSHSIWPTGKPARPIGAGVVRTSVGLIKRLLASGYAPYGLAVDMPLSWSAFVHDRRTRGIAEGRRLAAARREPGTRVVLHGFENGTAGLVMFSHMRLDVGKVTHISRIHECGDVAILDGSGGVAPWAWPLTAMSALPWQREAGR